MVASGRATRSFQCKFISCQTSDTEMTTGHEQHPDLTVVPPVMKSQMFSL